MNDIVNFYRKKKTQKKNTVFERKKMALDQLLLVVFFFFSGFWKNFTRDFPVKKEEKNLLDIFTEN